MVLHPLPPTNLPLTSNDILIVNFDRIKKPCKIENVLIRVSKLVEGIAEYILIKYSNNSIRLQKG